MFFLIFNLRTFINPFCWFSPDARVTLLSEVQYTDKEEVAWVFFEMDLFLDHTKYSDFL